MRSFFSSDEHLSIIFDIHLWNFTLGIEVEAFSGGKEKLE